MSTVFDAGLQPERTLLSWRRTCLSFGLAGAVAVRLGQSVSGPTVTLIGLAVIAATLVGYLLAGWRYRNDHDALTEQGQLSHGAGPLLVIWGAALLVGGLAAGFVVGRTSS